MSAAPSASQRGRRATAEVAALRFLPAARPEDELLQRRGGEVEAARALESLGAEEDVAQRGELREVGGQRGGEDAAARFVAEAQRGEAREVWRSARGGERTSEEDGGDVGAGGGESERAELGEALEEERIGGWRSVDGDGGELRHVWVAEQPQPDWSARSTAAGGRYTRRRGGSEARAGR